MLGVFFQFQKPEMQTPQVRIERVKDIFQFSLKMFQGVLHSFLGVKIAILFRRCIHDSIICFDHKIKTSSNCISKNPMQGLSKSFMEKLVFTSFV